MKEIKVKESKRLVQFQKDPPTRLCAGVGFPIRRSLHEAGNIKPTLQWKFQNIGDARIMGHLLRKAKAQRTVGTRERSCAVDNRAGEVELPRVVKPRWLHHEPKARRDLVFSSRSCFSPILPCYVPVPHVWNRNVYFEPVYIRSTLLKLFYRNSQLKRLPEFQKKLCTYILNAGTVKYYIDIWRQTKTHFTLSEYDRGGQG